MYYSNEYLQITMKNIILSIIAFVSPSAFANNYNLKDAGANFAEQINAVQGFIYLPLVKQLGLLFILLGVIIGGLLLLHLVSRFMIDREKTKDSSGYTLGLRLLNFPYAGFKFALGLVTISVGIYIVGVFIATVYSSFYLASAIDREKHIDDARFAATVNALPFISRAVIYKADMLQLQRKYAYEYKNADFILCLNQNNKLEINSKTKVVVDKNQINFSECAKKHLGIDKIKFADIPYDSNLSYESNKRLLTIIDDSVYLAQAFIRNECSKKDKVQDENNYLSQCSLMKDNVVALSDSEKFVVAMEASPVSEDTLDSAMNTFISRYADVAVSEVESYLDKKEAELNKSLEKLKDYKYGPLDLISATFKSSSIISEIDTELAKYTVPAVISVNLSVLTNDSADKFRYKARGGKQEKIEGNYQIKKELQKYFSMFGKKESYLKSVSSDALSKLANNFSNNAFAKYGYSNEECLYNHKECRVPSMNLAAQNIALGKKGVSEHFDKAVAAQVLLSGLDTIPNGIVIQTVKAYVSTQLYIEKFLLFVSVMLLIYIISRVIFNQFGNYLTYGREAILWLIRIIPETFIKATANELDKGVFKLDLNYPLYFLSFPFVTALSFLYGLFLMTVGAIIAAMVSPIVVASIIPTGLELFGTGATYLFFYVMMGFLFNKTLGVMDKQFLGEFTKSIIGKADESFNEMADEAHNRLTKSMNTLK